MALLTVLFVGVSIVPVGAEAFREASGGAPRSDHPVVYRPPVKARVTDPFRPPLTPYGPGHRGIDYATVPGTLVGVAAAGVVVFAGAVAGGLHVTVLHPDGIRTTYSFLATIGVRRGQALQGGDVVGVAAALLHVGARRGDTYIDPASLWGSPIGPSRVHLVPLDGYQIAIPRPVAPRLESPHCRPACSNGLAALGAIAVQAAAGGVGRQP